MLVDLIRLRHHGKPLDQAQWAAPQRGVVEIHHWHLANGRENRRVRQARFGAYYGIGPVNLPPLNEVEIVKLGVNGQVIGGIERVDGADHLQRWWFWPVQAAWDYAGHPRPEVIADVRRRWKALMAEPPAGPVSPPG